MPVIRAVFFDVGECLVDETAEWGRWADWLGVPRHTFSAVFGAMIARGRHFRETFQVLRPGFDLEEARAPRAAAGRPHHIGESDLYPDARPCLVALRALGLRVGIAANQPARTEQLLEALQLPVDIIATSAGWGVAKPAPEFFTRVAEVAALPPAAILYVGDRLDNDILPAHRAGMATAFIPRGPWGHLLRDPAIEELALFRLTTLTELPDLVARHNAGYPGQG
ncbi:MAG TPA: HAD family hydrolase [Actinophytocola sp.]|uniref:HAD family hydrolase n=1 Tax=Actinophytocola sp. TaxID=1872138 RepID=UPI002DBD8588|nr:HAD family hydrolase [Actinophytocola sp.]HEU5474457.1 HAD family hydrolase [Actinophytocola sp.]